MTNRIGKAARDIFAPSQSATITAVPTSAERQNSGSEPPYVKATVVLRNDQVAKLDRLCADVRARSGTAIARAELIRAMIDAVLASSIELAHATSEEDLRNRITRGIKTP